MRCILLHNRWKKTCESSGRKNCRPRSNLQMYEGKKLSWILNWTPSEHLKSWENKIVGRAWTNFRKKEKLKKVVRSFYWVFRVVSNTFAQKPLSGIAKVRIVKSKFQNWKNCEVFDTEEKPSTNTYKKRSLGKRKSAERGKLIFFFLRQPT